MDQECAEPVAFAQVQNLDDFRNRDRQPAVTAGPERSGIVVFAIESPAVVPKSSLLVHQEFDVQQELVTCLLQVFGTVQQDADFRQRQYRHHQRVIPQLVRVRWSVGFMLQAIFFRSRHVLHDPFGPLFQVRQVT
ncbi:hypothetical protein SDC9_79277 [bioreactor metagenome]|uniref:Uncharacterized protein n=1 Tax=bioreactor metagenome TaxID=1076179 RepID=A0A644YW62_9ZZZZ